MFCDAVIKLAGNGLGIDEGGDFQLYSLIELQMFNYYDQLTSITSEQHLAIIVMVLISLK